MQAIFTALFGPVFTKEMIELARRRRYYLVRVFYGLAVLFVLYLAFENYSGSYRYRPMSIHEMAAFAEGTFHAVGTLQFIALIVFVPMFLCGVVAGEREEGTIELLFTTTLKDREIILGKMLSRLVVFGLLIAMTLPIFGLISFFGGISPPALYRLGGALFTALLFVGAHSIYYSTITKSPMGALVRTIWRLILFLVILPYAVGFVVALIGTISYAGPRSGPPAFLAYLIALLCATNPIVPLVVSLNPQLYEILAAEAGKIGGAFVGEWFFPSLLVVPWAWSGLLIWRATRRLRVVPTKARFFLLKLVPVRKLYQLVTNRLSAPFRVLRSPPERFLWRIPVRNPLWLRARQSHCMDREGHLGRLQAWAWVVAAFFLFMMFLTGLFDRYDPLSHPGVLLAFLPITWLAVLLFTTIVAGVSVVGDRRRGFFDLLLTTPLSGPEIVNGIYMSVWSHITRIALLPLALSLLFLCTGAGRFDRLVMSLGVAYLFLIVVVLQGVACSLCSRTLTGALVPTVLFVFIKTAGIALLFPIFDRHTPAALWFLCVVGLAASSYWVRKRINPASVGCYFLFVQQCFVSISVAWMTGLSTDSHGEELAVAGTMPSVLVFAPLEGPPPGLLVPMILLNLASSAAFCFWAKWWLGRHFELLVGRASARERRPGSLAAILPALIGFFYWRIPETVRPRWPRRTRKATKSDEAVLANVVVLPPATSGEP